MGLEPHFAVRDEILGVIDSNDIRGDLQREIARIIALFDDGKTAGSLRREIVDLIGFIEEAKVRFLRGELRAKDLYREVNFGLHQFELRYRGLNCRDNRVFSAYYSAGADREAGSARPGDAGKDHMIEDISTS